MANDLNLGGSIVKLWLLEPAKTVEEREALKRDLNPGSERERVDPWLWTYDLTYGFVIRADTEDQARAMAEENAEMKEGVWLNPEHVSCTELLPDGEPGVVLRDYLAG